MLASRRILPGAPLTFAVVGRGSGLGTTTMTLLFPLREPSSPQDRDQQIMELALRQARHAWQAEEVPVGAIIVRGNQILGRGANGVEALKDATAHAEMLALSQAFATVGEKRLVDAELYCTLEPCIQCTGALLHARIKRVVYGAADPKFGGIESLVRLLELPGLNHRIEATGGVLAAESAALLQEFFRRKRAKQPLDLPPDPPSTDSPE